MKETFGDRLLKAMKNRGYTKNSLATAAKIHPTTLNNWIIGKTEPDSLKLDVVLGILNINRNDILHLSDDFDKVEEESSTYDKKTQAFKDLNKIVKNKNKSEGRIIHDSDLVPSSQYIIPLKGQAGLRKAFFYPDEYIDTNFEKETIYVKPAERGTYYKIEVDGNSMVGKLDPGDWTRCEDIPRMYWIEKGTFKPEKIYCLIHRTRGILFKRISKIFLEDITLTSDNPDKIEFPDETFDLNEFSKILIVRKIEKDA